MVEPVETDDEDEDESEPADFDSDFDSGEVEAVDAEDDPLSEEVLLPRLSVR